MNAFHFTLQRLLDAKEALEKAAELRVSDAQRKVIRADVRLARLREMLMLQLVKQAEKLSKMQINSHDMSVRMLFANRLERHVAKQEDVAKKCRQKLDEEREFMLKAIKERKSLENLKDREKKIWIEESRQKERRDMDEIALSRFLRQEITA